MLAMQANLAYSMFRDANLWKNVQTVSFAVPLNLNPISPTFINTN